MLWFDCFARWKALGSSQMTLPARFALTPFGDPLRSDAPDSVWSSMIFWDDLLADAWIICLIASRSVIAQVQRWRENAKG